MKISVATKSVSQDRSTLLAILLHEKDKLQSISGDLKKAVAQTQKLGDFQGKKLATLMTYEGNRRLLLVGLGGAKELELETLRRAGAALIRRARQLKLSSVALVLPQCDLDPGEVSQSVTEGMVLANYQYHGVKTSKPGPVVKSVTLYVPRKSTAWAKGLRRGQILGESQCFARDLGNAPGNVLTARGLGREAQKQAKKYGLRCKVIQKAELVRRKFGGLLGVNQGSKEPPVFIEMEYRPASYKKTVCLIGKGLIFDAGGISLKPAAGMEDMKFDKCGGAAVVAAMVAIARLKPKVRVHALVPSTDNLPSGSAIRPGDILTSYGGISVEIINTDAEGRLIMADAYGRAHELKPDYTVDLATLTGACVVALGHRAAGVFSESDELRDALLNAGEQTHERFWPLPHWQEYQSELKSSVADIKNSGGRWGGAITAYAFLKKFAGDLTFAHLDIAGTAWDMPKNEYYSGGATGAHVRALAHWLETL